MEREKYQWENLCKDPLMRYSCIFSWQSFFFTSLQLVKQAIFFGHGSLWIYKKVILNFCWFCFKPDFIISFDYSVKVVYGKWLLCQENIYLIKAMFVLKVWHNFWFIKVHSFIQNIVGHGLTIGCIRTTTSNNQGVVKCAQCVLLRYNWDLCVYLAAWPPTKDVAITWYFWNSR